jgi:hypothetical protein
MIFVLSTPVRNGNKTGVTAVWIRQNGKALGNRGTSMKLTGNTCRKRTEVFKEKPWFRRLFPILFGNAAVE